MGLAYVDLVQEQAIPKLQKEKVCLMRTRPPRMVFKTTELPKTSFTMNMGSIGEANGGMRSAMGTEFTQMPHPSYT